MFRQRISLISSVAADNYLNFNPEIDTNWMIRNIDTPGESTVEFYNSTESLSIEIENQINGIHLKNKIFHCSPEIYYRLKNTSDDSQVMSGEGFVSREDNSGDTLVQNIITQGTGTSLDIRPEAGDEWSIHNIMAEDGFELYKTNNTNSILSKRVITPKSALTGLHLYCTNSVWWRVSSLSKSSQNIGFDGIKVV